MQVSLERELKLHGDDEELLVPKEEEPPDDVEQPHVEIPVVEITTTEESSREGRKHSQEADKLMQGGRENVV